VAGFAFISFARKDLDYVGQLVTFLRGKGIEVWYDEELVPGRRFDEAIEQKIAQCAAFIVVITPAARESEWVVEELDEAKRQHREILPLLLEGEPMFGVKRVHCERVLDRSMPSDKFVERLRILVGEGDLLHEMKVHHGHVRSVAYPVFNSSLLGSAGPEKVVRIWHPGTGQLRRVIPGATWPVAFTAQGDRVATGGPGNAVHLWDTESGELITTIGTHKKAITSIAISRDGKHLVTGSADTTEQVWDLTTGEFLRALGGRVKPASPLVFSPDGAWVIAPTETGAAIGAAIWKIDTGRYIGTLRGHRGKVHDVTVSWDGRYVATGGEDRTARIWDAKTGDELQVIFGHASDVRAVAFSPSGYRLATGSTDGTIRLWDATNGASVMCVSARAAGIYDLAYSPDGKTLASGHGNGAVCIWKA
jgi:WD40 repeat protein